MTTPLLLNQLVSYRFRVVLLLIIDVQYFGLEWLRKTMDLLLKILRDGKLEFVEGVVFGIYYYAGDQISCDFLWVVGGQLVCPCD